MIKALAHVCLHSHDLDRTLAFYRDGLGLEVAFRFLKDGEVAGFYLRVTPEQFIEVFPNKDTPRGEAPINHLCLETGDIEALRDALTAKGIELTAIKKGADQSWQMWATDPDGTRIEFHQYTPESSQHTGTDCIKDW